MSQTYIESRKCHKLILDSNIFINKGQLCIDIMILLCDDFCIGIVIGTMQVYWPEEGPKSCTAGRGPITRSI